jgi:1-acyl-sn-glycerol-3-phosphate acyltransferase
MIYKYLHIILSVPVFGILYVFTAFLTVLVLFFAFLGKELIVRKIMSFWARGIFVILGKRLTVHGTDNLEKQKRYILLVNHCSLFDIPAVMSFYPEVSWFGREYLLGIPLFGKLLKITDYVSMKDAGYRNTKRMLNNLVQNSGKHTIAIFPEGTRTKTGKINRFYKGFIYLMRSVKLDILPVTLNGLFDLKPKTRFYIDFSANLHVVIHKPIPFEDLINKKDNEIIDIVKLKMESGLINKPHCK